MAFSIRSRGIRIALGLLAVGVVAGAAGGLAFYWTFLRDLPTLDRIEDYRPAVVTEVRARDGRTIGEFYTERRRVVPLDEIPKHALQAFVAAEDGGFYQHKGVDYQSVIRAAIANLRGGEIKQGASTITQQTVKSLLLSPERTFRRKFREIILARRLEEHFSKDQILFLYVNQIYFGNGSHGIGDAARSYFSKEVSELTVGEAALLAGLPQRPSAYSPYRNPEAAEKRRRYVLGRMKEEGFIDETTYREAMALPPELRPPDATAFEDAAYFTELVRRYVFERLGSERVLAGGLVVETTLDLDLQHAAVSSVRSGIESHDRRAGFRGPLRTVSKEAIGAEIARLASANFGVDGGLPEVSAPGDLASNGNGDQAAVEAEVALLEATGTPTLPFETPLEGVVTEVSDDAQRARVVFAPGIEGSVHLDDVSWAREPNIKRSPRPVKKISLVFEEGDVARFVRLPDPELEEGEAAPDPRLTIYQEPEAQGALLALENGSGDVLALVGGYDFAESEFDRVTQAKRQPGSAFKPFIFGAALSKGYTAVSEVVDRPVVYSDPVSGFVYKPRNYTRKFYGPISLRRSLAKSINNATVHLFRDVGVDYVIDYARRLGIQSELSRDLSLALGSSSLTLLEMTRAYAVFANEGRRVVPRFVARVVDRDGKVLIEDVPLGDPPGPALRPLGATATTYPDGDVIPTDQIISPAEAFLMTDLLGAVIQEGTGRAAARLGRHLGGKTGTTNEQRDAWFVGFSSAITAGAWIGHDQDKVLGYGESGGRAALPIWRDFMKGTLANYPAKPFPVPGNIVHARVDPESGLLADAGTAGSYFQPFLEGTQPTKRVSQTSTVEDAAHALRADAF